MPKFSSRQAELGLSSADRLRDGMVCWRWRGSIREYWKKEFFYPCLRSVRIQSTRFTSR